MKNNFNNCSNPFKILIKTMMMLKDLRLLTVQIIQKPTNMCMKLMSSYITPIYFQNNLKNFSIEILVYPIQFRTDALNTIIRSIVFIQLSKDNKTILDFYFWFWNRIIYSYMFLFSFSFQVSFWQSTFNFFWQTLPLTYDKQIFFTHIFDSFKLLCEM